MIKDSELEAWQQEWRDQTEPLPELKKKIRRQNLRTVFAIGAICVCLVFSTVAALAGWGSFLSGLATGMWVASILLGGYAWRARRGSWKPAAQTTLAYAELAYKRSVAKGRILRFAFHFLLTAAALYAGFVIWRWRATSERNLLALVLAALVAELFLMRYLARRNRRDVEEAKRLVDQTNPYSDVVETER